MIQGARHHLPNHISGTHMAYLAGNSFWRGCELGTNSQTLLPFRAHLKVCQGVRRRQQLLPLLDMWRTIAICGGNCTDSEAFNKLQYRSALCLFIFSCSSYNVK